MWPIILILLLVALGLLAAGNSAYLAILLILCAYWMIRRAFR